MDKWQLIVIILFCLNVLLFIFITIYEIRKIKKIGQNHDKENIIELEDHRPVWGSEYVVCPYCGYGWVAVYHKDAKALQCPKCERFN